MKQNALLLLLVVAAGMAVSCQVREGTQNIHDQAGGKSQAPARVAKNKCDDNNKNLTMRSCLPSLSSFHTAQATFSQAGMADPLVEVS